MNIIFIAHVLLIFYAIFIDFVGDTVLLNGTNGTLEKIESYNWTVI